MVKRENRYPEGQYTVIIMVTCKGLDNNRLRELCSENYCEDGIVPHNFTNKFQPLHINVNKVNKGLYPEHV